MPCLVELRPVSFDAELFLCKRLLDPEHKLIIKHLAALLIFTDYVVKHVVAVIEELGIIDDVPVCQGGKRENVLIPRNLKEVILPVNIDHVLLILCADADRNCRHVSALLIEKLFQLYNGVCHGRCVTHGDHKVGKGHLRVALPEELAEPERSCIGFPETQGYRAIHAEKTIVGIPGQRQLVIFCLFTEVQIFGDQLEVIQHVYGKMLHERADDIWHILVKDIDTNLGIG